jgi:CubicO group peptidase (beta-lactamase class C family)
MTINETSNAYRTTERIANSLGVNAKQLCSGVFVVGRSPEEQIEQELKSDQWEDLFDFAELDIQVDYEGGRVTLTHPAGISKTAVYHPGHGATLLPDGADDVFFRPVEVIPDVPDPTTTLWPTGDLLPEEPLPASVDGPALEAALDWAFGPSQAEHKTRGVVVCHQGRLIAERYAPGFDQDTRQICWSTGKSITAALVGILVQQGCFTVDDYAPIEEWKGLDDPHRMIRVRHLLNMSSGLRFRSAGSGDPEEIDYTSLEDHSQVYFAPVNVFEHSINKPLEFVPGSYWRYRNCDPLSLGAIVRRTVEARGEEYLTFPQRALFDKIGAGRFVLEPDAWGNFIMTGFEWGTPRDWARFALLHLWDGVWRPTGERILPPGWSEFVSTPAPADHSRGYGGQFWLNAGGSWPEVPRDAYWPAGGMGQYPVIIPSRDVVVVRMGHGFVDPGPHANQMVGGILAAIK